MTRKKRQVRVGFAGLGKHMNRGHLKHLRNMPEVTMVGFFDPGGDSDIVKVETLECGEVAVKLKKFSSYEKLIASPIDAIFIGSPDHFHGEQLLKAVRAGKHVFCEKPVAVTNSDVDILEESLDIAEKKKLIVMTCHPRRFDPPFIWLKKNMARIEGSIGEIRHFDFSFWYHEVNEGWKTNRSLLSDHYGHEIDIFRFLFGSSHHFSARKISDSYDRYEVVGASKADKKISFRFFGTRSLKEDVFQETVRIDGDKGSFFVDLNAGSGLFLLSGRMIHIPWIDYDLRFAAVNENFIHSILGKAEPYLLPVDLICNNESSVLLDTKGAYRVTAP